MNFGSTLGATAPKTTGGFTLSLSAPSTTAATQGFSLGGAGDASNKMASTTNAGLGLASQVKTTGIAAVSTSSGFSLTSTTGFSLAPTSGFSLAPTSGFSLGAKPLSTSSTTASIIPTSSLGTTAPLTLATTSVVSSNLGANASLNFCQLEEGINKWTLELEEQEKIFMNQATQVNAWDRILIANGERIVSLNNSVERVKAEQQQLDNELDFILAQQRELEDCLAPLEKEMDTNVLHDPEREHTYLMAENMDTQLKQMSEDLKEIIEHLNESNQTQDNNDPIVQIGRILNAHMNSLQWIDQNTALIATHLDQVAKLHDAHRRENERSFHLTYD